MSNATLSFAASPVALALPRIVELNSFLTWRSLITQEWRLDILYRQVRSIPWRHRTVERWELVEQQLAGFAGPSADLASLRSDEAFETARRRLYSAFLTEPRRLTKKVAA